MSDPPAPHSPPTATAPTPDPSSPQAPAAAATIDHAAALAELSRGEKLFAANDFAGARAAFEQAIAKDASLALAWSWRGRACVVKSNAMSYSLAIESYERALALHPTLVEAHWGLGLAHMGYAHSDEARREFEAFLAGATPASPPEMRGEAEHFLGILARERGETESALAHFDRAQELHPRFGETPYERGLTLEGAGRKAEAVAAFRAAIEIDPSHLPSHFRLARLLRQLGDLEGAAREERIHQILNLLSDDLTGRTTRAPEKRVELYGELCGLAPKHWRARLEYARALTELKREGEAALALDDLLRERPPLAEAYVLRGELALRARDDKRAKEAMEALAAAMPQITPASLPPALRAVFPKQ